MALLHCSCGWTASKGKDPGIRTTQCPDCAREAERTRCADLCKNLPLLHLGELAETERKAHLRCAEAILGDF